MIIGPSGSGKTTYLLRSLQKDKNIVDKIWVYAKDLEEPKYKLLINKREQAGSILIMILLLLLNILILWMIFMMILRIITKKEREKF